MKESTFTTLVISLLALSGAISLMIVAPSHSALGGASCADRAGFSACR